MWSGVVDWVIWESDFVLKDSTTDKKGRFDRCSGVYGWIKIQSSWGSNPHLNIGLVLLWWFFYYKKNKKTLSNALIELPSLVMILSIDLLSGGCSVVLSVFRKFCYCRQPLSVFCFLPSSSIIYISIILKRYWQIIILS